MNNYGRNYQSYGRNGRDGGNRGNRQKQESQKTYISEIEIDKPLSEYYADPADLYLPKTGAAYKFAEDIQEIKSNQVRKILNEVKACSSLREKDFSKTKSRLFVLVPMTAYNSARIKSTLGRRNEYQADCLFEFVKKHINETTIQSSADVEMFDKLFTSIVAYHKQMGK